MAKILFRILSVPLGILVGVVAAFIFQLVVFDEFHFLPLASLIWKLGPGALLGAIAGYFYPTITLFLSGIFFDGTLEADGGEAVEFDSQPSANDTRNND